MKRVSAIPASTCTPVSAKAHTRTNMRALCKMPERVVSVNVVCCSHLFIFLIDMVPIANIQRTRSPRREGRKIRKRKQLLSSLKSSLSTSYTHFSLSSPSFCSRIFTNLLFGRYSRNEGDPPHMMRSQSLQPELCALDICWDDHTGIVVSSQ